MLLHEFHELLTQERTRTSCSGAYEAIAEATTFKAEIAGQQQKAEPLDHEPFRVEAIPIVGSWAVKGMETISSPNKEVPVASVSLDMGRALILPPCLVFYCPPEADSPQD